ncbi:MAG: T9SS type A sorting domain-containing protein, partial [Saprospiraceae bacterium]|nr:T9SS type A sorting domain-containing protein [Saprospiraceae bacterium]MCB0683838.1 T9SS type A sorting domain-containing protein [Saprospiraceae bacterium]
ALRLAPNPVHAQLEISGEALANSRSWEVLDPRGRLLQAGPVTSEVQQLLPTDRLPAGLYLLVLRDLEGQVIEVARFVKE